MEFDLDRAQDLLARAAAHEATAADIVYIEGESFLAQVRLGEIEKISSAKGKRLGLRVFLGKRSATVATSDLHPEGLDALLRSACDAARYAEEDDFSGLPEAALCATEVLELDLVDAQIHTLSIDEKIDFARRAEQSALAYDPRITNSEGADFRHTHTQILYAASHGFKQCYPASHVDLSVSPIATENGEMQRDYWYSARRQLKALMPPEEVGKIAAERTLRRLGSRKILTQQVPVVFDAETASSLLEHWVSALSGYALYKQASFLVGCLGKPVAAPEVTLEENPTLRQGLGSRPFDAEGLPARKKTVISHGILSSYLLDTYSGRKLGMPSTGNASRSPDDPPSVGVTNFYMTAGKETPEAIIGTVSSGLYVTDLMGFGVNTITGDYSRGASGFWIENGHISYPVEEITIAGNLKDMFFQIEGMGTDLELSRRISAPTLKIARMMVAGS